MLDQQWFQDRYPWIFIVGYRWSICPTRIFLRSLSLSVAELSWSSTRNVQENHNERIACDPAAGFPRILRKPQWWTSIPHHSWQAHSPAAAEISTAVFKVYQYSIDDWSKLLEIWNHPAAGRHWKYGRDPWAWVSEECWNDKPQNSQKMD